MRNPPLLFLDCETLGLDDAPIWEIAAIRVDEYGNEESKFQTLVKHNPGDWVRTLPLVFQDDYETRYRDEFALEPAAAVMGLGELVTPGTVVCGSNPSFDMERLNRLAREWGYGYFLWHYHPEDIPTLARGWLNGRGVYPSPPWKSDLISQMCGVDPREFDRHTAMGDVEWTLALYRRVNRP